jgi:hypothetical protein
MTRIFVVARVSLVPFDQQSAGRNVQCFFATISREPRLRWQSVSTPSRRSVPSSGVSFRAGQIATCLFV